MEVSDQPTGSSHFSWAYELEWRSHKVTRQGYLVFGTPTRATAALTNTNDGFLLYLLPPLSAISYQLSVVSSNKEVFFRLTKTDERFNSALRLYTAAANLVATSSGHTKSLYESKAQTYLRDVVQWLQEHKPTAFEVTYQGRTQMLIDWLEEVKNEDFSTKNDPALFTPHPSLLTNFRDLIDLVADGCLDNYFSELAPEYPIFPILVSQENLLPTAQETLRGIANPNRSKQAQGILAALGLLDGAQLEPNRSKYAAAIVEQLHQKPAEQVLNRVELLSGDYFAPATYRLEPELVMVLIAALVYAGELVLVMPKQQFDASNFATLAAIPIKELLEFRHLEHPKEFNLPALKALFELLGLPSGLEVPLTQNEDSAVQQLQTKVSETLRQLVQAQHGLATRFLFWGKPILSKAEMQHYRDSLAEIKTFLESLHAYSTPLKFKNFRYTAGFVTAQWSGLKILQNITQLIAVLADLSQPIAYLTAAEATLPPQHQWHADMNQMRDMLLSQLSDVRQRNSTGFSYHVQQQLSALQKAYINAYLNLHQQARFGPDEEQAKQRLLTDKRLLSLKKLAKIALLPHQQLIDFENRLNPLQTCYALSENDLIAQTICPHCGYKPLSEPQFDVDAAHTILTQLEQTLEQLYRGWTQTLLAELENAAVQRELLKAETRAQLEAFLTRRSLPEDIAHAFIEAVQEGLAGLVKVTVNREDLQKSLLHGGSPVTVREMQKRFNDYLNRLTKGKELSKVRIVLE